MRTHRPRRSWGAVPRLVLALLVIGGAMGLLASGLALPVTAGAAVAVKAGTAYFDTLPDALVSTSLPQTSVMLAADGSPITHFYDENRSVVPLTAMAASLRQAIVAVEDSRFYQHGPVDPRGLVRAALNDLSGGSTEGASTLTQQYVKNVLLEQAVQAGNRSAEQAATARTTARKLQELRYAVTVEQQLSKSEILQRYLNIVYFGEQTYGVQAAAYRYFAVPAARLTLPQAALLAGMVQDPSAFDPVAHPAAARARRDLVLTDMRDQKMITPAAWAAAVAAPVVVRGSALGNGCEAAGADGFFCAYVLASLLADPAYAALGSTPAARARALQTGGLVIRTTLDPATQAGAVRAVDRAIPTTDSSGLATTAVTVEPGTGAVLAMAEDRTYAVRSGPGLTSVNYAVDTDLGGSSGFQTGSAFKPFTLATWLAAGGSLDDTVDATRRPFAFSDFTACGRRLSGSQAYVPGNSEGTETGPMSVEQATANSVNVAYVAMETSLDLCDIASTASSLGVHLAAPERECTSSGPASTDLPTCLPSLTLGVKNIAPLTMAAAYAGFASGGTYCAPLPVASIGQVATDTVPSTVLARYPVSCRQALDAAVASGVDTALARVLTDGTAAAVGPLDPWPCAGKTGTTDGPYDSWFVGYTAQRSTAVWVADPGHLVRGTTRRRRLTDLTVDGRFYPTVFGASIAAPIWKAVMTTAMRDLPALALP